MSSNVTGDLAFAFGLVGGVRAFDHKSSLSDSDAAAAMVDGTGASALEPAEPPGTPERCLVGVNEMLPPGTPEVCFVGFTSSAASSDKGFFGGSSVVGAAVCSSTSSSSLSWKENPHREAMADTKLRVA